MKPHLLVKALVDLAGGALPVAVAMNAKTFQGTLWKICDGRVASPSRSSAERIAKHFGIPVDAIYSEKIAADVWREKFGGAELDAAPALEAEPARPGYTHAGIDGPAPADQWPFRRMTAAQWAALDDYDRVLVEEAAASKLRELVAERAGPATDATSTVRALVQKEGAGRQRRQILSQEQVDRRNRQEQIDIERRHFERRGNGGKS